MAFPVTVLDPPEGVAFAPLCVKDLPRKDHAHAKPFFPLRADVSSGSTLGENITHRQEPRFSWKDMLTFSSRVEKVFTSSADFVSFDGGASLASFD